MSLNLTPKQVGDVTLVAASGRITLGEEVASLRDQILRLAASGQHKIVLNLAEVSYVDSSGMGELVSVYSAVRNQGGMLKLLNLTKRVQDLLRMTKLSSLFEVFEDEATALSSFAETKATGG